MSKSSLVPFQMFLSQHTLILSKQSFNAKAHLQHCLNPASFDTSPQSQGQTQMAMPLTEVDTCPSSLCSSSPSQDSFLQILHDLALPLCTLYIMYRYQTLCILYIVLCTWPLYDVRPIFCGCRTFNFPSCGTIKDSVLFYFPLFPSSLCLRCLCFNTLLLSFHLRACGEVFSWFVASLLCECACVCASTLST